MNILYMYDTLKLFHIYGVWTTTKLQQIYIKVQEIEKSHQRRNRPFYIDNDFYENIYNRNENCVYYKFMKRRVNDWENLENDEPEIDNIIYGNFVTKM